MNSRAFPTSKERMLEILLALVAQDEWWRAEWKHRRAIVVVNNLDGALPSGTPMSVAIDTAYLGIGAKSKKDLSDLVLVHAGSEIPCWVRSGIEGRATLWFRTAAEIPKEKRDGRYALYYGNPAGTRTADVSKIFDFREEFGSGSTDRLEIDADVAASIVDGRLVVSDAKAGKTEQAPALLRLKTQAIPPHFALSFDLECEPDPNAVFSFGVRVDMKETIEVDEKLRKRIEELVDKLGATDWQERENATKELVQVGRPAVPKLEEALKSGDAEIQWRAEHILKEIRDAAPWPVVMAGLRVGDPEVGPVALSWRIGKSLNRQRHTGPSPIRLNLTLERDPEGNVTILWDGGKATAGELKGEVNSIAFYLTKGAGGTLGTIRIDDILLRSCVDEEGRPTHAIEVERTRP